MGITDALSAYGKGLQGVQDDKSDHSDTGGQDLSKIIPQIMAAAASDEGSKKNIGESPGVDEIIGEGSNANLDKIVELASRISSLRAQLKEKPPDKMAQRVHEILKKKGMR